MELIDDELVFPYSPSSDRANSPAENQPQSARTSWSSQKSNSSRLSSGQQSTSSRNWDDSPDSFLDLGFGAEDGGPPTPGLYHGNSSSETSRDDLHTPTDESGSIAPWQSAKVPQCDDRLVISPMLPTCLLRACEEIEDTFQTMLLTSYGVHPRPHEFILDALSNVFGPDGNARKMRSFHLSLVEVGENDEVSGELKTGSARGRPPVERDIKDDVESIKRVNREQLAQAQQEGKLTAKAARLLGVVAMDENTPSVRGSMLTNDNNNNTDLGTTMPLALPLRASPSLKSLTSSPSRKSSTKGKYRQGLFIFPNQFLETSERELDMYVSKNMHVLLSCGTAINDFVLANAVDTTSSVASDVLNVMLQEYERLVRSRC